MHATSRARLIATLAAGATALTLAPPAASAAPSVAGDPAPKVRVDERATSKTKGAAASASKDLAKARAQLKKAQGTYQLLSAKATISERSAQRAERHADWAEAVENAARRQSDDASDTVDSYAADLYKSGPVQSAPETALVFGDGTQNTLASAAAMKVIASRQAGTLVDLREVTEKRADSAQVAADARRDAQDARRDAQDAKQAAQDVVKETDKQTRKAAASLRRVLAKARAEGRQARADDAARKLATLMKGWDDSPARAATDGPGDEALQASRKVATKTIPAWALTEIGDGVQGPNHLRPRADRYTKLVKSLFDMHDVGGWRPSDAVSQDHPSGRAVDVMLAHGKNPTPQNIRRGWELALWTRAHAEQLGVTYIIWQDRIWSTQRDSEGWRVYSENFPYGSYITPTTLHLDHVHVSFTDRAHGAHAH